MRRKDEGKKVEGGFSFCNAGNQRSQALCDICVFLPGVGSPYRGSTSDIQILTSYL